MVRRMCESRQALGTRELPLPDCQMIVVHCKGNPRFSLKIFPWRFLPMEIGCNPHADDRNLGGSQSQSPSLHSKGSSALPPWLVDARLCLHCHLQEKRPELSGLCGEMMPDESIQSREIALIV